MILLSLLRFLRRTPWATAMAVLGVTLGVTSIVAVHLISQVVARQMDDLVPAALRSYNYVLTAPELKSADYFSLRRQWLAGDLPEVRSVAPLIDETVFLFGQRLRVVGLDWTVTDPALSDMAANAVGEDSDRKAATESFTWDGVWIGPGVTVGDDLKVNGTLKVPGLVVADIGLAQELLGWADTDQISVIGIDYQSTFDEGAELLETFAPGASAGLPARDPPVIGNFTVQSFAAQHPANAFGKSVLFNISALGLLALVVAWFLIYQVAVFWLRRLDKMFARLTFLGVEDKTLAGLFLTLMGSLGSVAGIAGLFLGQWFANWMLSGVLPGVQTESLSVALTIKALGSAVVVCLVGGGWAFVRNFDLVNVRPGWSLMTLGLMVPLVAAGLFIEATHLVGAFTAIAILSVVLLFLMTPLLTGLRSMSRIVMGSLLLRLGLREVVWFPRDLATAMSGLALAMATAMGVGLMVESFRSDFVSMLDSRLSYDQSVTGPASDLAALMKTLADQDGRVQPYQHVQQRIGGAPVEIVATDLDAYEVSRYGYAEPLSVDEVLVSEQLIRLGDVALGDTLVLADGEFTVVGEFQGFGDIVPRVLRSTRQELMGYQLQEVRLLDVDAETLLALQKSFPDLSWQSQASLRDSALRTFDQTFVITSILVAIAIGVAGIGVYIAVTVLRLNQQASERLLEGLGISSLERRGLDLARGLGVGLIAALAALPLGWVFGWILCQVVNPRAFGWSVNLQLDMEALLVPVMWGLFAAVTASMIRIGQKEVAFDGTR